MTAEADVREFLPSGRPALEALYPKAFPEEDLLPLVRDLLDAAGEVVSLVAEVDGALAGHVAFTRCGLAGRTASLALLGPLAVHPDNQGQGIGSALVSHGLQRLQDEGVTLVLVLGDPGFYGRFGFMPETGVAPPYDIPDAWRPAWQSVSPAGDDAGLAGTLTVPQSWHNQALWAP